MGFPNETWLRVETGTRRHGVNRWRVDYSEIRCLHRADRGNIDQIVSPGRCCGNRLRRDTRPSTFHPTIARARRIAKNGHERDPDASHRTNLTGGLPRISRTSAKCAKRRNLRHRNGGAEHRLDKSVLTALADRSPHLVRKTTTRRSRHRNHRRKTRLAHGKSARGIIHLDEATTTEIKSSRNFGPRRRNQSRDRRETVRRRIKAGRWV